MANLVNFADTIHPPPQPPRFICGSVTSYSRFVLLVNSDVGDQYMSTTERLSVPLILRLQIERQRYMLVINAVNGMDLHCSDI